MAERAVLIRLSVKDADRALAELRKIGIDGERSLDRLDRGARSASRGLQVLDAGSRNVQTGFRGFLGGVRSIEGPLGGFAGRLMSMGALFGGIGSGAVAAGAAVAALGAGFFFAARAGAQAEAEIFRVEAILRTTGFSAGVTQQRLERLAEELGDFTLASVSGVREAEAVLLTFRNVQGEVFEEGIRLANDLSAVYKQDLPGAALQLGKALNDPIKGVAQLNEVGVQFTDVQKEMIKQLVQTGNVVGAQKIILEELRNQVGGAARGQASGVTGAVDSLRHNWGQMLEELGRTGPVADTAKGALDAVTEGLRGVRRFLGERGLIDTPLVTRPEQAEAERKAEEEAAAGAERQRAQQRRDELIRIEKEFNDEFLKLQSERAAKVRQEEQEAIERLQSLRTPETAADVDRLITRRRDLTQKQLAELPKPKEALEAERLAKANETLVDSLKQEAEQLADTTTQRQRAIDTELRKLSASATDDQRKAVEQYAGAIFDEDKRLKDAEKAQRAHTQSVERGVSVVESFVGPLVTYEKTLKDIDAALQAGRVSEDQASTARRKAKEDLRAFNEETRRADEAARETAAAFADFGRAIVESNGDIVTSLDELEKALFRIAQNKFLFEPFEKLLSKGFSGDGGLFDKLLGIGTTAVAGSQGITFIDPSLTVGEFHRGGTVRPGTGVRREVPASTFAGAPRLQTGTVPGLRRDEIAAILHRGEEVLNRDQAAAFRQALRDGPRGGPTINLTMNVRGEGPSIRKSAAQAASDAAFVLNNEARRLI